MATAINSEQASKGWADLLAEGRLPRFALICLAIWLNAADSLVTATIMPSVGADIGGYAYFGWATAGFLVGAIMAGASAGRVAEIFGLRLATTVAGLALALGCVLSALAPHIGAFLAGRLLQGIGGGWISGFAMVAITLLFPERHLARVFASISGVWGVATVLGPLLGGLSAQSGDWRLVFWLFALQALVFAAAAPWLLKGTDPARSGAGVPWLQLGTLGLGVGAIAVADVSHSPAIALSLIVAGLGILSLVLRIDSRAQVRLLPRGAGNLRTVGGSGYATLFALAASSMGLLVYGPAILQQLRGLPPLWAGYVVALQALSWTLASFVVVGAAEVGQRRWIRIGAGCVLASVFLLTLVMRDAPLEWVIAATALMGAGFGVSVSLINRRIIGALSDEDRAVGGSALIAARQTGGAVGAAIAGATANIVGFGEGLTDATAQAAAVWVFATALPLALAASWAAWRLTGTAAAESAPLSPSLASPSQPRHPLLQELEALDPRQMRELACATSMLWDEFTSEGVGPDPHTGRGTVYVLSMRLAAYRVRQKGGPEKLHYALAPELMATYAEALGRADPSSEQREIAVIVEQVNAHGALLRRTGDKVRSISEER
jgi:MFS family permease